MKEVVLFTYYVLKILMKRKHKLLIRTFLKCGRMVFSYYSKGTMEDLQYSSAVIIITIMCSAVR